MPAPLLRRCDQLVVAVLTAVALAGAIVWWIGQGGHNGGLIEFDNSPALEYAFTVDVNQAEWPELAQLPGIGETLAKRIIDSREVEGRFRTFDDIDRVKGIGPRKLEQLRQYLLPMPADTQTAGP